MLHLTTASIRLPGLALAPRAATTGQQAALFIQLGSRTGGGTLEFEVATIKTHSKHEHLFFLPDAYPPPSCPSP